MKKCLSLLFVAGSMLVCASKAHAQVANPTTTTPAATPPPAVNTADLLMVGAFAISDSSGKNPLYTPLKTLSTWADLEGGTAKLEYGIFVGQLTNLGFADNLKTTAGLSGFLSDIKSAYRIAPRIGWKMNKMKIGVEVEYTQATRGSYATGASAITELAADSKTTNTVF